jgi:hypothetical protein
VDSSAALNGLPATVRAVARVDPNGEVSWPLANVADALTALTDAGFIVLDLDTRTYDEQGQVTEIPFADYSHSPLTPEQARDQSLAALHGYTGEKGDWVLVTWTSYRPE